jgi:hypothetical protein
MIKRLFPHTHASAMRLWWHLVALWYWRRANKAYDKHLVLLDKANVLTVIAKFISKRADEWDAEVQRMREKK